MLIEEALEIAQRLVERYRKDAERMWPPVSDLDLLAAEYINRLAAALQRERA